MRYIHTDSEKATQVKNQQVLGDASPLEFDEDGRAGPIEDKLAERVVAMDAHLSLGRRVREDSSGADEGADENGTQEAVKPPIDPTENTVSELEEALKDGEFSEAELDAIAEAEGDPDDEGRPTAHKAIDAQRPE